jgi:hypothetical protein
MTTNRRRGEAAVPDNYKERLSEEQIAALRKLESFGWTIKFLRRPQFQDIEVVLIHSNGKSFALLSRDGELDQKTKVSVRRSDRDEILARSYGKTEEDPKPGEPASEKLNYMDESPAEPAPAAEPKRKPTAPAPDSPHKEPIPTKGGKPPKFLV